MRTLLTAIALLALALPALGDIQTREIEYEHDGVKLRGFLAFDGDVEGRRPGVLIVHEWWGHNEFAREQARRLAREGYTAFAADMYGAGIITDDPARAQELATRFYTDRSRMRECAAAGLKVLSEQESVDAARLAAIGYCFGGTVALELGRSGAELRSIVSFHGGLGTPTPRDARNIKGAVLVLTGGADPLVPAEERAALVKEMEEAEVQYQMIVYGGAKHSFTNPAADGYNLPPVGYHRDADEQSWAHMLMFFERTLRGEREGR